MRLIGYLFAGLGLYWLAMAVRTAWFVTHPRRGWRPDGWLPSSLALEPVAFRAADGTQLRGWIAGRTDAPATVICVHGWGTNHTELQWRAERLHDAGFSILLFDFRACGESEGQTTSVGVLETQDLEAALGLAQTHPQLNGAPVLIAAHSMGASVSLVVAARHQAVRAVFSDSAFASLESTIAWGFRAATGVPAWPFQKLVVWLAARFSGANMHDLPVLDSVSAVAPRPLLLTHGTDDRMVSPQDAEALYAQAGEPKELWMVPGAGHVVAGYVDDAEYTAKLTGFFRSALGVEAPQPVRR